jgi:hypothetical protein
MDTLAEVEAQEAFRREWREGPGGEDYPDGEGIPPWPEIIPTRHARPGKVVVITAADIHPCVACARLTVRPALTCGAAACLAFLRGGRERAAS